MENRPSRAGQNVDEEHNRIHQTHRAGSRPSTAQQRNQQEHQLTGVHITEQPHAVGHGFGNKFQYIEQEVGRCQPRAERRSKELMHPAADAFDFNAVIQTQQQYAGRQCQGQVDVGRGHGTQIMNTQKAGQPREQIHRQQVHGIHKEHPHKYG